MKTIISLILISFLFGCAGPFQIRKTEWTVPEVVEWYEDYSSDPYAWDGILYRGTDETHHHFTARVLSVDNWAIIEIKNEELKLQDIKPYSGFLSSLPYAYYYVDPSNNFKKLRDFEDVRASTNSN